MTTTPILATLCTGRTIIPRVRARSARQAPSKEIRDQQKITGKLIPGNGPQPTALAAVRS